MNDLSVIEERLQYLQGLFQRKLLEDRAKNELVDALTKSLRERDALDSGAAFRDLFREALVALDRLREQAPDRELVESVHDELLDVFARRGLEPVATDGRADPGKHEVVGTIPATAELPAGRIVAVERDGFTLGGRLLRPARVVVAAEQARAST